MIGNGRDVSEAGTNVYVAGCRNGRGLPAKTSISPHIPHNANVCEHCALMELNDWHEFSKLS